MAMNQVGSCRTLPGYSLLTLHLAIQAMERPPMLHPADRALMRPPNALGKPTSSASGISFLRRTEYTTSHHTGGSKFESSNSSNTMRVKNKRRRPVDISQDDPINICKHILKGFNLAYPADAYNGPDTGDKLRAAEVSSEEKQAWKAPKHPSNSSLQVVDSYPILPDWEATPDGGAYMMYKFSAPPVQDTRVYDERLDVALLRPIGQSLKDQELFLRQQDAQKDDPTLPVPLPRYHFEFFLPPEATKLDKDKLRGIKRNFTTYDPDNEDEIPFDEGADDEGRPRKMFKYENIRVYETKDQRGDSDDTYGDVVALALHDPGSHEDQPLRSGKLQKAAYFYPISTITSIRQRRPGRVDMVGGEEAQKVDIIETTARNPEIEAEKRDEIKKRYDVVEV